MSGVLEMIFSERLRAYSRMQGAIHGKTAQKNNADCHDYYKLSTSALFQLKTNIAEYFSAVSL